MSCCLALVVPIHGTYLYPRNTGSYKRTTFAEKKSQLGNFALVS